MNIALIGYGKMGREIEKIALSRNHKITLVIDIHNIHECTPSNIKKADVAIEFSTPHSAFDNVMKCFEAGVPVVSGTTGWIEKLEEAKKICLEKQQALFWSSNFSLGVNLFFRLNEFLSSLMTNFPDYGIQITEVHHVHKLDAPSGTAVSLAKGILRHYPQMKGWTLLPERKDNMIPIQAIREGEVPGIHTIRYESAVDFIEITHSAKNRQGFALGAVMAAEFLKGKKGVFDMNDLLDIFLRR